MQQMPIISSVNRNKIFHLNWEKRNIKVGVSPPPIIAVEFIELLIFDKTNPVIINAVAIKINPIIRITL